MSQSPNITKRLSERTHPTTTSMTFEGNLNPFVINEDESQYAAWHIRRTFQIPAGHRVYDIALQLADSNQAVYFTKESKETAYTVTQWRAEYRFIKTYPAKSNRSGSSKPDVQCVRVLPADKRREILKRFTVRPNGDRNEHPELEIRRPWEV